MADNALHEGLRYIFVNQMIIKPAGVLQFLRIAAPNHHAMFRNYLTVAIRQLSRHRAYAIINVLGLTLAITCTLLIFLVVSWHFSFDRFHSKATRIYQVTTVLNDGSVNHFAGVPGPLAKALRNDFAFVENSTRIVTYSNSLVSTTQHGVMQKYMEAGGVAFTAPSFFKIFDFPLLLGDPNALQGPGGALLTETTARKYFGTPAAAMGQSIRFKNKISFTVKGVLRDLPGNTDVTASVFVSDGDLAKENPFTASDSSWGGFYGRCLAYVLVKPGTTPAQMQTALKQVVQKNYRPDEITRQGWGFEMVPLRESHFFSGLREHADKKNLWTLAAIAGFILLTACVNFINLSTARALNRAREIGVRKVMGSLRGQLLGQFLVETALITFVSVLFSIMLTLVLLPNMNDLLKLQISMHQLYSPAVLVFLPLLAVLVTLLAGGYPGVVMARFQPVQSLRGSISQQQTGGFSLRRLLVVLQFTISQVLIIGVLVVAWQMYYAVHADLGFQRKAIVMVDVPEQQRVQLQTLRAQLQQIPGVHKASVFFTPPASVSGNSTSVQFEHRPQPENWYVNEKDADDQYLSTFGLQLVAGRNFFPADSAKEFVVNEKFVKLLGIASPAEVIGRQVSIDAGSGKGAIVGVVKDFYNSSFHNEISPVVIMPNYHQYTRCAVVTDPEHIPAVLKSLSDLWSVTFPNAVFTYEFVDDHIARFYEQDYITLRMVEVFTLIAVFIGCLGLYGLAAFMAANRTREIGVRKVLGAGLHQILWLFGKEFTRLLLLAFLVAAPLGWYAATRYLEQFKYHITPGPAIFLLTLAGTGLVAVCTVGYLSVRASLANPVKSLRAG